MGLFNWLTGFDTENAERAAAADAEIQRRNAENANYQTAEKQAILERQRATDLAGVGGAYSVESEQGAIDKEFSDTLDKRAESIFGGPLELVRKVFGSILKAVPLWLWLVLAVGLFLWLGGAGLIRGILAKGKK